MLERSNLRLEVWTQILPCMEAFAASMQKDVVIRNLQGESSPLGEDLSKVYVNFCSVPPGCIPPGGTDRATVDTLFGVPLVDTQRYAVVYDPPEEEEGLYREICDSKRAVAVHRGNTLWIFNSLSHKEAGDVIFWLGSILTAAMPLILDQKSLPGRWSAAISAVNGEVQRRERSLKDDLLSFEEKARKCEEALSSLETLRSSTLRKIAEYKEEICGLQGRRYTEQKFEDELSLILRIKGVNNVEVIDAKIYISIDDILVPFKGDEYIIAPLTISIDIVSRCLSIKGTEQYKGHCHPHVCIDGIPCWGDAKVYMQELIENYEFSTLASMTMAFLRQVNRGDWFEPVTEWPRRGEVK